MRVHGHRSSSVLAGTLVVLLFVVTFNAHACLLPVNVDMVGAMDNTCSTPDEQPVSQYCDAFKALGVHSANQLSLNSDSQALCPEDTASLALLVLRASDSSRLSDHPTVGPHEDLLLKISVLRI
jgi:hypothetical protein